MSDYLANSNRALILAMGMHWENEREKANGYNPPYAEDDFITLIRDL